MFSDVHICNLALKHVGMNAISDLSEARQEARECKLVYETLRDTALREHAWVFASKAKALTPVEMPTDYDDVYSFAYLYPTDALQIRLVRARGDKKPLKFRVMRSPTNSKIVLVNTDEAIVWYTMRVTDSTWFDTEFVEALALLIGSRIAVPLRKNAASLAGVLYSRYVIAKDAAEVADIRNENDDEEEEVPWIKARTA